MNNDVILIDGIIDDLLNRSGLVDNSANRGKIFEKFSIEQILKNYDLTDEQISEGLVDGGDDGGIDGFYIFVNGVCFIDEKNQILPRSNAELEIFIITCKHHDTYQLNPLESLDSSLSELFDLSISNDGLKSTYKIEILKKRNALIYLYRKLAPVLNRSSINTIYVSRGNSDTVASNIHAKGEKIRGYCKDLFFQCDSFMTFWGIKELITQFRKKRNGESVLKTQKTLQNGINFIVLSTLEDFFKFVTDEQGKLKRYYFEENVRDYLGENRTNIDILRTLEKDDSGDFWLLNNGITILTSRATPFDGNVEVENIQIVNGLQTTYTIYRFFSNGGTDTTRRCMLIKLIVSTDDVMRNDIIQATNNQSSIPIWSLHATDKIQKDIEDVLYREGLFYERKSKYYQNLGYDKNVIFEPLYLAAGYVALIMKLPHRAAQLKSKFMNNSSQYGLVFSNHGDLRIWPAIARILRKTDIVTERYRANIKTSTEKYLRIMRPIVSLIAVAKIIGKYTFSICDLIAFETNDYTDEVVEIVANDIVILINESDIRSIKTLTARTSINIFLKKMSEKYNILGFDEIEKRREFVYDDYEIDDEFLQKVKEMLPPQPWSLGVHKNLANELCCSPSKVYRAISQLVDDGVFRRQINGIIH